MRRSFFTPTLAVAIALGCADRQSPTAPSGLGAPAYRAEKINTLNGFLLGGDPANPLVLQAGAEPGVTAADLCADPGQTSTGVGKAILTPPGGFHENVRGRDVSFVVYSYGGGIVTGPCSVVGAPIVGTGTGDFSYMTEVSGRGVLVIHVTARGTIDLVGGGQARVYATALVTVRPDGSLVHDVERVKLDPL
jgi:hypothetical protein